MKSAAILIWGCFICLKFLYNAKIEKKLKYIAKANKNRQSLY